ncbi:hypothetical protein MHB48_08520 [Psychrobacillus sp. FSL H8-0483]|uniref:hypothetical protein n=1 Tax=Psychrobacillus sp. FSL H8-0483 TaxID=2921389 RepID=UPI00315AE473
MKKFFLLLIVIFIAGCNGIPQTSTDYVQAQGKVIVGNQDYSMMIDEFVWKEKDFETRKLNDSNIYDLADEFNTLEVEKDDKLKIEVEQNPSSIIVNQWNEDGTSQTVELNENEITLPSKEGNYIYEVMAEWSEGKISYVFDINIE